MLPTRADALTHTQCVPWTEPEPENDVVMGANRALLPSFKSILDSDWYTDQPHHHHHEVLQNDAFLMQHLGSSSSHFPVPPKPSFSSFFTDPFDNSCFDLGSQSGFLAELSSNPEFPASQQLAGLAHEEEVFSRKGKAVRPLDGSPTLFQKRAERREGGELGELVLQELRLPVVPQLAAAGGTDLRGRKRGEDGEGGLNCECDDEVGKLMEDRFDGNENGNGVNGGEVKGRKKGMPAKNLMAERRRRKKLNDRLYMLRSVVPKISKMDRASILGDAIDYLKELLQQINDLHNELDSSPPGSSLPPSASFQPVTPTLPTLPCRVKEELCPTSLPSPKNQSAKVEVRVREGRAVNIHMFCARRPGLLLSTMRALDNLGLDVQQAVISCFNGFALDVFRAEQCREDQDVLPEQIKAVLLDTAGFHGMT